MITFMCVFLQRIDVRGKLMSLHGLPHSYVLNRAEAHSSGNIVLGLVAVCRWDFLQNSIPINIRKDHFQYLVEKMY